MKIMIKMIKMKEPIFVDTSFLIALFSKKDENHTKALKTRGKIQKNPNSIALYYSDYIFDELITFLKKRKELYAISHAEIIDIGEKIKKSKILNYIHITEKIYEKTWEYIQTYQDKDWSFTDMSSFVLMDTFEIKYYLAYDKHFAQYPNKVSWA
jgi:uncharacterized protein